MIIGISGDRTNPRNKCGTYADIPKIIPDILKNGAIVSRNRSKAVCGRALWQWTVPDVQGNQKPLIEFVSFNEVYDESKTNHFKKTKGWTNFEYSDMKTSYSADRSLDLSLSEEAARWGYAMYIADDPVVAKYFRNWIKKTTPAFRQSETLVCAIYARDADIFDSLPKIWAPENRGLMTNVKRKEFNIAWSREN
ncbi:hypothetical protein L218DRAFT_992605 [Marasmius fiardii PR-910]|nr:hypothetical protein L218DRAFT_992605 [Marasmius fiardii PR-910]